MFSAFRSLWTILWLCRTWVYSYVPLSHWWCALILSKLTFPVFSSFILFLIEEFSHCNTGSLILWGRCFHRRRNISARRDYHTCTSIEVMTRIVLAWSVWLFHSYLFLWASCWLTWLPLPSWSSHPFHGIHYHRSPFRSSHRRYTCRSSYFEWLLLYLQIIRKSMPRVLG